MNLLYRLLTLGCLAVALGPLGQAQTQAESDASTSSSSPGGWLGTEEPRAVAWRAHDAMVAHDVSSIPELLSLASRWQPLSPQTWQRLSAGQEEGRDAMAAVLDALIQLNAPVSANTSRNLAPDFEGPVAVLLARMPVQESGPLNLDFYRSPPAPDSSLQYVSAALLALHPGSGFAGELLADIKVQATVFVILPGGDRLGGGSGSSCGPFSRPARDDWPVTGQYRLSGMPSASVIVAAIDCIYVTRVESTRYLGNDCGMLWGVYLGPEQRRRLIAETLGVSPEEIPWKTNPQTTIEFESPEDFNSALLAFVQEQQHMHLETAEALEARKLLASADVLQSLPLLRLNLSDERPDRMEPLTKDANLPDRVDWWPY